MLIPRHTKLARVFRTGSALVLPVLRADGAPAVLKLQLLDEESAGGVEIVRLLVVLGFELGDEALHFRPRVAGKDAFWARKQHAPALSDQPAREREYQPIEMPKNSAVGFITAFFAVVTGFALIWHIWWMVGLGLAGAFLAILAFAFRREEEIEIPAAEIARFDRVHEMEPAQ